MYTYIHIICRYIILISCQSCPRAQAVVAPPKVTTSGRMPRCRAYCENQLFGIKLLRPMKCTISFDMFISIEISWFNQENVVQSKLICLIEISHSSASRRSAQPHCRPAPAAFLLLRLRLLFVLLSLSLLLSLLLSWLCLWLWRNV